LTRAHVVHSNVGMPRRVSLDAGSATATTENQLARYGRLGAPPPLRNTKSTTSGKWS
jgi:hypothetical protein